MRGILSAGLAPRLGGIPSFIKVIIGSFLLMAVIACSSSAPADSGGADTIKVGVLHSLSGTMSISETAVKDATLMAIDEINAAGGVMGKQIEVTVEDGASDWPTSRRRPVNYSKVTK